MATHKIRGQNAFGRIDVDVPKRVEVDGEFGWLLTYTAGDLGVKPGGKIRVLFPPYVHEGSEDYVQIHDWWRTRFLYAYCPDETVHLHTDIERIQTSVPWVKGWNDANRIAVIVAENGMKPGTQVLIRYGGLERAYLHGQVPATRVGPMAIKRRGTFLAFEVSVDVEGDGEFRALDGFPPVEIVPGKPDSLTITAPTIVRTGEEFEIKLLLRDHYGNPVFDGMYDGLTVLARDAASGIETTRAVAQGDSTCRLVLDKEGVYRIELSSDSEWSSEGAMCWCRDSGCRVFWGDIHTHSSLSPNIRDNNPGSSPEECYTYAREVSFLDFICLCEQTMKFDDDPSVNLDKVAWARIGEEADAHYRPERMVTFPGFELHSKRGDTVVLFANSLLGLPYPENWVEEACDVWRFFDQEQCLTIPHFHPHSGGRPSMSEPFNEGDWAPHSERLERLAEVFSTQWGRLECPGNPMLMKLKSNNPANTFTSFLGRGRRWGTTAGSDDHDGKPGYGGLTAVLADSLTRESVFDALQRRRCYATTHPRMIVDFEVDGHLMGEEVFGCVPNSTPRRLHCIAAAAAGIKDVELIRNGEVIHTFIGNGGALLDEWFCDESAPEPSTYYYVRVRQVDGHMAWSSPVWLIPSPAQSPGSSPPAR